MATSLTSQRTAAYKPGLARFAAIGTGWVFVLVVLGAFTTTINAGMVFSDWPTSNGSFNPIGWLSDRSMFAEHSHRLSAIVMGTVTIILAIWLWRTESRAWLRKLAYFAVGLVIAQGVVGGLRVLLDGQHVAMVDTSVGRLFAMLHAVLAQFFMCTLIAIAVACSRGWIAGRQSGISCPVRRAGAICCLLLFVQLAIAAVMRHSFAGLAIATFPASNFMGGLLPKVWNFHVGIHFAHRVMALVLFCALPWFVSKLRNDPASSPAMRTGGLGLMLLLGTQIFLGAQIIWTQRGITVTTAHVLVGALTLATTFWLTWLAHRDVVEAKAAA